jgi:tagatose 1,6-diphosphate aldolase GatY/KbaY
VPVALHLDHGDSFELAMQALRAGYTSIMIDGSHNLFEDNIAVTKRVVDACIPNNIPVEGELGKVGGKEDDLEAENDGYTVHTDVPRTGNTVLCQARQTSGTASGVHDKTKL